MLNRTTVNILGVRIDVVTIKGLNRVILNRIKQKSGRPLVIFKPYVEFLSLASRNDGIRKLLNKSDINAPDSVALQWAASYLYGEPKIRAGRFHLLYSLIFRMQNKPWLRQILPERMAGVDQTLPLLKAAGRLHLKIGIIGGPRDTEETRKQVGKRFAGADVHVWSGYFHPSEERNIVKEVAVQDFDILFCAMGFPKQEKFIIEHKNQLNCKVIIGEGGSFDYDQLGGSIKRAPGFIRKIGFEWFWRLLLQPKRVRRQLAIPQFISNVAKQKKSKN